MRHSIARLPSLTTVYLATALAAFIAAGSAGCSRKTSPPATPPPLSVPKQPTAAQRIKLHVWVPCAYSSTIGDLVGIFAASRPHVEVSPRVENVSVLARRILEGAKPDVFMCVGDREVKAMEEAGLVAYRSDFCFVTLGLVAARGNPLGIRGINDLAADKVQKIGIGTEDISVGHYARMVLNDAGLWENVQGKLVEAKMPIHLLQWVGMGKVDASLAYAACLRASKKGEISEAASLRLQLIEEFEHEYCQTIPCPAVSVNGCEHPDEAKQFIEFLTTDQAQDIISAAGFLKLGETKCRLY
ncbi:MAG: molybdate ABC transporter substrate-binding protein [Armatimonadota bacterium]